MLEVTALGWTLTIAVIVALLALDLTLGVLRPHAVGFREATAWSVFYIAVAIAFGVVFGSVAGWDYGTEYFAGYIVEKSLSVDNLFVFVIIMGTFAVPEKYQQEVLTFGIIIALVLRVIFIALGATLLVAVLVHVPDLRPAPDLHGGAAVPAPRRGSRLDDNVAGRAAKRIFPVTDDYVGGKLFTRLDGKRMVTPLFIVLIAIGSTDLLFALDSIPAVFGVTEEAYIVFAANAFALLGLRALFFLVKGLLDRLVYLSTGLAIILAFIGAKLVLHWAHSDISTSVPEISTPVSLGVILVVLVVTTVASLVKVRKDPDTIAHAGSLRAKDPRNRPTEERPRQPLPGPFFRYGLSRGSRREPNRRAGAPSPGVEDLADLPRLLVRVAAQDQVELGALGRRPEGRQFRAEPAPGDPLGATVRQVHADFANRGLELHDPSPHSQ